jgi:hypothetical protein
MILLSPPHERTKPVVPDVDGHDSAASVMPSWRRRWPTRQVEPEESDNIRRTRDRVLADAIRASGAPRIEAWGRHNDPVKGLPVGGVILDAQPDIASARGWMRQNGVAWDDSERKGAIPAGRRSSADVGNAAAGGNLVDRAKVPHPRWRQHPLALDDHAYRAYRRRLQETSWRSLSAPPTPKIGKPKTWKRFDPTTDLTAEGHARYDAERWLDKVLAHHTFEDERPWADGTKVDRNGNDGGWARFVGIRKADKLLARQGALERVEADVDARLAGHHDAATAAKADLEKLVDTINDAAQRLPDKDIFDALNFLLNARDPNGELGATENVLVWMADQWGIKTDVVRRVLAYQLATAFREPLRPWAAGRTGIGAWVPPVLPAPRSVSADAFEKRFAAKNDGRPPDHDPRLVALALYLAEGIYHQLEQGVAGDQSFGLAAIEGYWRDRWPPEGIALALRAAATAEITAERIDFKAGPHAATPRFPSPAEIEEIVARVGYGRPGSCRALAFEVAALAYNLPRKALEATVKRTK